MRKIVSYGIDFSIPSYSQEIVWTHRDLPTKLWIKMDVVGCENQSIHLDSNEFYKTYNVLSK